MEGASVRGGLQSPTVDKDVLAKRSHPRRAGPVGGMKKKCPDHPENAPGDFVPGKPFLQLPHTHSEALSQLQSEMTADAPASAYPQSSYGSSGLLAHLKMAG